jgi:VIT1/CCC1 family predicted Fe2+/Mn2+ transporter
MPEKKDLSPEVQKIVVGMQVNELTESVVYHRIAKRVKDQHNREILERIGDEEARHAKIWEGYTKVKVKPQKLKILWYSLLSRIFGFTFALKLMERGEGEASLTYRSIAHEIPQAEEIARDEDHHEEQLIALLDEERLRYVGSMVLGLSDALVELSGTLAGLTFALQNTRLIALSGLITGISATLSMASSEYLSSRSEGSHDTARGVGHDSHVVSHVTVVLS